MRIPNDITTSSNVWNYSELILLKTSAALVRFGPNVRKVCGLFGNVGQRGKYTFQEIDKQPMEKPVILGAAAALN